MSRIRFLQSKQSDFLNKIKQEYNIEWADIAKACRVHNRTLFDWRRNKYQMSYEALQRFKKKYNVFIPNKIEILPDTWNIRNAARLGAIRRNELYGSPGTPEGRRKGGLASYRAYRLDPQKYLETGFIGPKDIDYPRKSSLLSELVGIILGDGGITRYQVTVSLNNRTDREYAHFVLKLFRKLFNLKATLTVREKNTCALVVSSVKLIDYLNKIGLKRGDKIRQQVNIPKWILKNKDYMIACLRGLVDTDGGVYYHNHVTKGIRYRHLGLGFTSHSLPLLRDVHNIFLNLEFPAKINYRGHVFLYDREAIKKYFAKIGTHNIHHLYRYQNYFRSGEVPKWS